MQTFKNLIFLTILKNNNEKDKINFIDQNNIKQFNTSF